MTFEKNSLNLFFILKIIKFQDYQFSYVFPLVRRIKRLIQIPVGTERRVTDRAVDSKVPVAIIEILYPRQLSIIPHRILSYVRRRCA